MTQNVCIFPALDNTLGDACWSEGDAFVSWTANYWSSTASLTPEFARALRMGDGTPGMYRTGRTQE